ncbi:MAG: hypothetical protein IPN80_12410 [Flavobacterium sp.]|nr:hypothetical protein [Flavobacterium sp.]
MKYFYSTYKENREFRWFAIATLFLLSHYDFGYAQVRVPFKIRTSSSTPIQKNYSVNGDFSFIGNTNLTLVHYNNIENNNNNSMQYVDIDNDPSTWNSSSADLHFSNENGSLDSCTEIRYAGLYWTGRSTPDGAANSPNEFSITKILMELLSPRTSTRKGYFSKVQILAFMARVHCGRKCHLLSKCF